jgi:hypothetical protein
MLGEINLVQWRCLAELIDNCVDSFITAQRAGEPIRQPEVHITLPTSDHADGRIEVADNGPGMDPDTLENAMRAGWTGNDPINNLGLFGMGFNIATARLGVVTNVWTTRRGDAQWHGVQIDFEDLVRQRSFRTPLLSRPKLDRQGSGTNVVVSRLKPEHRDWFSHARNRQRVIQELGRVYSAMLRQDGRPVGMRLKVNEVAIRGRGHCIWDDDRIVETNRVGAVAALQILDYRLADRPFCTRCWQWLPSGQVECPSCGVAEFVVVRQRRIHGWLGIQRYLHEREFGIDILRHGRKIELANKELLAGPAGTALTKRNTQSTIRETADESWARCTSIIVE